MKKTIRITESDLNRIVRESVRRMVNEETWNGHEIVSSTEDVIERYYDNVAQAADLLNKAAKLLNGSINVHDIEWMKSNSQLNDIVSGLPLAIEATSDAYSRVGAVRVEMDEGPQNEPEDWYERNEHGDFDTY